MSLLEKLLGAAKKKAIEATPKKHELLKEKLKNLVYDDELVDELLPTFIALQEKEGFSVLLELLESKEQQIAALAGGDWFKQEAKQGTKTVNTEEEEQENNENLVDQLLKNKYQERN